jgi:hypothetical protein
VIARIERGRQDPAYETLVRLVRACELDLDVRLRPYDDHDDSLIRAMLALSPAQRLARLEEQSAEFADVQIVTSER